MPDTFNTTNAKRVPLVIMATSATFVRVFLYDQIKFLGAEGFDVHVVCADDDRNGDLDAGFPGHLYRLPLSRSINPLKDIVCLIQLFFFLRRVKPAIVHTHTPKAGIIGMSGAWLCGIRNRVHTIHGLRCATLKGRKFTLVSLVERVTCLLAAKIICVSDSLRAEAVRMNIAPGAKLEVLGRGACAGVDLDVFDPMINRQKAREFRRRHRIEDFNLVVTYIGRIANDKGLTTLISAWETVSLKHPEAVLVVAGPIDETDPVEASALDLIRDAEQVRFLPGFTSESVTILATSDLAVQPSYREGLGVSALEAEAMGVPVVASCVTGLVDAVDQLKTGLLVTAGDPRKLAAAIERLIEDAPLRQTMGEAGRPFVTKHFDRKVVSSNLLQFYRSLPYWPSITKRAIDLVGSILGIVLLTPVALMSAAMIRANMGSPVFFRQQRAGHGGRPFEVLKFRTMLLPSQHSKSDASRLTNLGRWLRKLSIDEIPQLINVFRGEMSLVGPRPLLLDYLPRYSPSQNRRHMVVPGITGWAQVHGRNNLGWDQKFALDVWYVDNRSLLIDLQILWLTMAKVFSMSDVNPEGVELMQEFIGASSSHSRSS